MARRGGNKLLDIMGDSVKQMEEQYAHQGSLRDAYMQGGTIMLEEEEEDPQIEVMMEPQNQPQPQQNSDDEQFDNIIAEAVGKKITSPRAEEELKSPKPESRVAQYGEQNYGEKMALKEEEEDEEEEEKEERQQEPAELEELQKPKVEARRKDVTNEIIIEEAETDRSQLLDEQHRSPRVKVGTSQGRSNVLSHIVGSIDTLKKRKEELKGTVKTEAVIKLEQESKELMAKVKLKQTKHKESQQQQFSNNLKDKASKLQQGDQGDMREKEEAPKEKEVDSEPDCNIEVEDSKEQEKVKLVEEEEEQSQEQEGDGGWDALQAPAQLQAHVESEGLQQGQAAKKWKAITFHQAADELYADELLHPHLGQIKTEDFSHLSWFSKLFMKCSGNYKMKKDLASERDMVFQAAKVSPDQAPDLLEEILLAIYKKLRGVKPPGRYGQHWQEIGFQGNNPATDLRSVGILGALMALYFVEKFQKETIAFLNLVAETAKQDFPIAVTLVQFTQFSIKALRQGRFTQICNVEGQVISVFNDFYAASVLELFSQIRRSGSTAIIDYPPIKALTQEECLKGAKRLIRAFREKMERTMQRRKKQM